MKKLLKKSECSWWTGLCIVTSALTMQGCSWLNVQEPAKPIQANLLEKCPELSKHEGVTGKDVMFTLTNWASEYNECRLRHEKLIDAVSSGM